MTARIKPALPICGAILLVLSLLLAAACQTDEPAPTAAPAAVTAPTPAPTATPMPAPTATEMPAPTATATAEPPTPPPPPSPTAAPPTAPTPTPSPNPTPAPTATTVPEPTATATATPAPEPHTHDPTVEAVLTELADGVYHYFALGYTSLIVVGDDAALVVDPSNDFRAGLLAHDIEHLTSAPVTHVVLTHEHYDHIGGTGAFPDAEVVCQWNCQHAFALQTFGEPPAVDISFDDFLEIPVGDKSVELHYLGPGDGDATTIVYLPAEQIVMTADLYEPRELTHRNWVDDKNFVGVRHILNTISAWDITHAVNGHSLGTDPVDLMENVAYYNDLYDAVKAEVDAAIAQAGGAAFAAYGLFDTLPGMLQLEQYREWGNYESSFPRHVERMLLGIYHGE